MIRERRNTAGRLWCDQLQLWLGTWRGPFQNNQATWLRYFDRESAVVPSFAEAERLRAEAERLRAESAEAELARLKEERR